MAIDRAQAALWIVAVWFPVAMAISYGSLSKLFVALNTGMIGVLSRNLFRVVDTAAAITDEEQLSPRDRPKW